FELRTAHGRDELDGDFTLQVSGLSRPPATATGASEQIPQHVADAAAGAGTAENILEPALPETTSEPALTSYATSHVRVEALAQSHLPELIVKFTLLVIVEDVIRGVDALEAFFGCRVSRI